MNRPTEQIEDLITEHCNEDIVAYIEYLEEKNKEYWSYIFRLTRGEIEKP